MKEQGSGPFRSLFFGLGRLLFPPRCEVCRALGPEAFCSTCRGAGVPIRPPFCHTCGRPFDPRTHHGLLCSGCREGRRFDRARSAYYYGGTIREAILTMKYRDRPRLAGPLGEMLLEGLTQGWTGAETLDPDYTAPPPIPLEAIEAVIPVPLHPRRIRERGFNQSLLLGERLAAYLALPLLPEVLQRWKDTPPQVGLSATERARNVRGAFAPGEIAPVQGKAVLLVDDIMTTGATVAECARVLKKHGAGEVHVLTLARQT